MVEVEDFWGGSANMAGTGGVPIPTCSSGVSSSSGSDPISPDAAAAPRGPMDAYAAVGDVTCETGNGFRRDSLPSSFLPSFLPLGGLLGVAETSLLP